jgi:tRNA A37 methylthiotransferase MiaB
MKKVGFVSLGCPKNLVDSEVMMGQLKGAGYEITNNPNEAETVVVNTCGFIESAKQESIDAILEATNAKTNGIAKRVVVAGCLVERYRDDLMKELPEVDAFIGFLKRQTNKLILKNWRSRQSAVNPRRISTISIHLAIVQLNRTRLLSKLPKAVIARARFVRFRKCAVHSVRGDSVRF